MIKSLIRALALTLLAGGFLAAFDPPRPASLADQIDTTLAEISTELKAIR